MEVGTKVVMTQQAIGISIDENSDGLDRIMDGMCFVYRGVNGPGMHEFAPDFDQGHDLGFQIDDKIFNDSCFRRQFKIVTEWDK